MTDALTIINRRRQHLHQLIDWHQAQISRLKAAGDEIGFVLTVLASTGHMTPPPDQDDGPATPRPETPCADPGPVEPSPAPVQEPVPVMSVGGPVGPFRTYGAPFDLDAGPAADRAPEPARAPEATAEPVPAAALPTAPEAAPRPAGGIDWDAALARVAAGEKIGTVADDIGISFFQLRSRWALYQQQARRNAAPPSAATAVRPAALPASPVSDWPAADDVVLVEAMLQGWNLTWVADKLDRPRAACLLHWQELTGVKGIVPLDTQKRVLAEVRARLEQEKAS
jgi:hypothetical protein